MSEETIRDEHEIAAARINLGKMLSEKQRGDLVTAREIQEATGISEWQRFRAIIRRALAKRGLYVEAVRNDGYRILAAREHAAKAEKLRKQALRKEVRCFGVLTSTPVRELNERESLRHGSLLLKSQGRVQRLAQEDQEICKELGTRRERIPVLGPAK